MNLTLTKNTSINGRLNYAYLKLLLPIACCLFFSNCSINQLDKSKTAISEIASADKAMCNMASKEGFYAALIHYADDSVIKPNEGEHTVIGKEALIKYWKGKPGQKNILWEPFRIEASLSGDFGYSQGRWKITEKDTVLYGNYYTIWKKQKDGKWKFVADGGNNTPVTWNDR